jgi:hypothetical protein
MRNYIRRKRALLSMRAVTGLVDRSGDLPGQFLLSILGLRRK